MKVFFDERNELSLIHHADLIGTGAVCLSLMNSVKDLALHGLSQLSGYSTNPAVWEVIGLIPIRDSDFFVVPRS